MDQTYYVVEVVLFYLIMVPLSLAAIVVTWGILLLIVALFLDGMFDIDIFRIMKQRFKHG